MIRIVSTMFAFAVLLCAYIIADPIAWLRQGEAAIVDVTRAQSTGEIAVPAVVASEPALIPAAGSAAADLAARVQANANASAKIFAASGGRAVSTLQIKTDESSITETSAGVLAALGLNTTQAAPSDGMLNLTAGALAGIRGVTGDQVEREMPQTALQQLVVAALQAGRSDADIDVLLNDAALEGTVTVPEMLVTSDGKVDTAVLLASIVSQAQVASGGAAPAVPEQPLGGAEGVEIRVVQTAEETQQHRFYTVGSGDSLGAIAVKFYGSVEHFPLIFEANRSVLSSPDMIRSGQRLVIPDLVG